MLRFYLDSNIFQVIKPSTPRYNKTLHDFLYLLKDKVLFCYSDAHLYDLKDSLQIYRDNDLKLMEEYVQDNYFLRDEINKTTSCYLASPYQAFHGKDWNQYNKFMTNPFDLDTMFDGLGGSLEIKVYKSLLKSFLNVPISSFGQTRMDALIISEANKQMMNKIIPDYHPNMSLGELIKSIMPYSLKLLHDKKEVAEMRKYIAGYMNRDNYSFEKWGMRFNEKFKESEVGKPFLEMIDSLLGDRQKEDFYLRFYHAYSMLEIFNITREKSGKKRKDFNLQSLNNDANHAYYASFSDYLVTDDKGLQVKANILYQLFSLPTKVLSTEGFLNMQSFVLNQEEDINTFSTALEYDLQKAFQLFRKYDPLNNITTETYRTYHTYFNYFNRLQIVQQGGETFVLYCERNSHANFFMYREIELIVKKLLDLLGVDDESKGEYKLEEKGGDENPLRIWTQNNLVFEVVTSLKSWGTFICLVFYFIKE